MYNITSCQYLNGGLTIQISAAQQLLEQFAGQHMPEIHLLQQIAAKDVPDTSPSLRLLDLSFQGEFSGSCYHDGVLHRILGKTQGTADILIVWESGDSFTGLHVENGEVQERTITLNVAPAETQRSVGEWINTTFPGSDPVSPRKSLRCLEEMVELCIASGATPDEICQTASAAAQKERRSGRSPEQIPDEAADVLILLYGLAHMHKFDLHAAVERKMRKNRTRKWEPRGDGTGYHVKG